jgi:hypothetical protein
LGLASQFCCWAHWARFFALELLHLSSYNVYKHIIPSSVHPGRGQWMDGNGCVQMSFLFWEHQHYLILDNNYIYICIILSSHHILLIGRLELRINESNFHEKVLSYLRFVSRHSTTTTIKEQSRAVALLCCCVDHIFLLDILTWSHHPSSTPLNLASMPSQFLLETRTLPCPTFSRWTPSGV